jgi:wyosine [tRNA(Phe)-imidazoG37] synthetase (radical SAM superfamily)
MQVFGPVQSRRFGMSLGINHLPAKVCSYACVYCQLGRTHPLSIEPSAYSQPEEIYQVVKNRLEELDQPPDYLTFVSNGEPCLDSQLGNAIRALKDFQIPTAVICNASLLWHADVRERLMPADSVSLKVDTVETCAWHKINRPHGQLRLEQVLGGIKEFTRVYPGRLLTETMLVRGVNDSPAQVRASAAFIASLEPEMAYLALPLRAPAEDWVEPPSEQESIQALQLFAEIFSRCVLLADLPETGLVGSGDPLHTLLETLKVHPMEREEVLVYLHKNQLPAQTLEDLVIGKKIRASRYKGKIFYAVNYSDGKNKFMQTQP